MSSSPLIESSRGEGRLVGSAPTACVTLLDGFSIEIVPRDSGDAAHDLPHNVQRLIAHVSLAGRPARGAIAGALWPDVPEQQAHGSLRSALWRLQKEVPGLVEVSGGALALAPGVRVDVHEFTVWARSLRDPAVSVEELLAADLTLRGDLLPGWYDDWVLLERERHRQLRLHALEALAERLLRAGRHGDAIEAAYCAVRAEPLRESARRVLICAHISEGNVAEALAAYESFRGLLADELGVIPTRQIRHLVSGLGASGWSAER